MSIIFRNTEHDYSGTITEGQSDQIVCEGNNNRVYLYVANVSSWDLWFTTDGTYATTAPPSRNLPAGAFWESPSHWVPTGPIRIIGAMTGQAFVVKTA